MGISDDNKKNLSMRRNAGAPGRMTGRPEITIDLLHYRLIRRRSSVLRADLLDEGEEPLGARDAIAHDAKGISIEEPSMATQLRRHLG